MIVTDPVALRAKLETAIATGKNKGLDTSVWQEKLKQLVQAQGVATETRELLETQGWCLWRCRALDDEVIVVASNEHASGCPDGYPVYTELEMSYLLEADDSTLRLVHQAKKLSGATVTGVEERKSSNA